MLRFDDVTAEHLSGLRFEVGEGMVASVTAPTSYDIEIVIELMLGLRRPASGRIELFGRDAGHGPYGPDGRAVFVFREGGLISNLSVYENIVLPAWYHEGAAPEDIHEEAGRILEHLGIPERRFIDYAGLRPVDIPVFERRLAGICRAHLMKPDLIVYESVLSGVRREVANNIAGTISEYREGSPDCAVVFIGTDSGVREFFEPDISVRL